MKILQEVAAQQRGKEKSYLFPLPLVFLDEIKPSTGWRDDREKPHFTIPRREWRADPRAEVPLPSTGSGGNRLCLQNCGPGEKHERNKAMPPEKSLKTL